MYRNEYLPPINPQYEFRVVEAAKDIFQVEAVTTNYNYGEDLADYGWTNAGKHPRLHKFFKSSYTSLDLAIFDVKKYRNDVKVVWQENDVSTIINKTQKDRLQEL